METVGRKASRLWEVENELKVLAPTLQGTGKGAGEMHRVQVGRGEGP